MRQAISETRSENLRTKSPPNESSSTDDDNAGAELHEVVTRRRQVQPTITTSASTVEPTAKSVAVDAPESCDEQKVATEERSPNLESRSPTRSPLKLRDPTVPR